MNLEKQTKSSFFNMQAAKKNSTKFSKQKNLGIVGTQNRKQRIKTEFAVLPQNMIKHVQ